MTPSLHLVTPLQMCLHAHPKAFNVQAIQNNVHQARNNISETASMRQPTDPYTNIYDHIIGTMIYSPVIRITNLHMRMITQNPETTAWIQPVCADLGTIPFPLSTKI